MVQDFPINRISLPRGINIKYIYISPRSGGKYMKKSAAYPVGFGKALLRKHQTFLEAWGYGKGVGRVVKKSLLHAGFE